MNVIKYEHHGVSVSVREDLKGKHRDNCLCFMCKKLNIAERDKNCVIANTLYALNQLAGITTPVFECKEFEIKESKNND